MAAGVGLAEGKTRASQDAPPAHAFPRSFIAADQEFRKLHSSDTSGTCATCVLVKDHRVSVRAHVSVCVCVCVCV
jgi:hypothetical protein